MRTIKNLRVAYRCDTKLIPKPYKEVAKLGLRYERKVFRALEKGMAYYPILHNQWYYFEDCNGPGYAVPDIIAPGPDGLVVLECKFTYKPEALDKLRRLYCPIVSLAEGMNTIPLVVVKNLTPDAPTPELSYHTAVNRNAPLLHWIGRGAIV